MDAATRSRIQTDYPAYAWLLDIPEVGALLEQAVTEGWGEAMFVSKLWATNWYRSRSESQRQMEALQQTDPGQFGAIWNQKYGGVQDTGLRLGLAFAPGEADFLTASHVFGNKNFDDPQEKQFLLNWAKANKGRVSNTGSIFAQAQRADNIARTEFFFAPTWEDSLTFGIEAALGYNNEDNYRQSLADWFAGVMPHLAPRLKGGETFAQIVNPYRDIIAKELELGGLEDVDMISSNQWKWLTGIADPTSGEMRLPTQQEVLTAARKDPRWRHTIGATALSSSLIDGITRAFGVRA
jgi:hypothetical protein